MEIFRKAENIQTVEDTESVQTEEVPAVPGAPLIRADESMDLSNVQIEPLFEDYVDFETFSKSDFRAVKVLECEAVPKSKKLLKFVLNYLLKLGSSWLHKFLKNNVFSFSFSSL